MSRGRRLSPAEVLDRAMSEDALLTAVMDLARWYRWLAMHVRRSDRALTQGDTGFPDVIAGRPGRVFVAELKKEPEHLTPEQEAWLAVFRACPGVEVYVWRPSDLRSGAIEEVMKA